MLTIKTGIDPQGAHQNQGSNLMHVRHCAPNLLQSSPGPNISAGSMSESKAIKLFMHSLTVECRVLNCTIEHACITVVLCK